MKAYVYNAHGSEMQMTEDIAIPELSLLGDHAVRIKIYAVSLNPIDYKRRDGEMKAIKAEKKIPVSVAQPVSSFNLKSI